VTENEIEAQKDRALRRSIGLLLLYFGSVAIGTILVAATVKMDRPVGISNDVGEAIEYGTAIVSYFGVLFCVTTSFCMARSKKKFTDVWRMSSVTSGLGFFSTPVLVC